MSLMSKYQQIQTATSFINQIPEREEDPSFDLGQSLKPVQGVQSTINPFQTAFNKFQVTSTIQPAASISQSMMKPEHNYMETMHKQYQLKELCEIPYVMLCDEDEKILFDLSVMLKFGDFKNILNATQRIQNQTLFDYPIELFLQRTDILRALIDLMEGSNGNNVYTNLVQPCLLTFVQRLKTLYLFNCSNTNKVSHVTLGGGRDPQVPHPPHIQNCYPCNHNGKWSTLEENRDANKYGATYSIMNQGTKVSNMTAASLQNSLSCKAALALILTRSIYLLKDQDKLGLYVQLITETIDAMLNIFKVEGNSEFSEILHLCLFAFDSVFDFYKDLVFDDLLVQSVLSLCLRLVRMLNSIQRDGVTDKYQMPFTECLFMNTQNLQRTLRRALFKCFFNNPRHPEQADTSANEILKFFERLETELQGVNLLQKNVTSSFAKAKIAYERYQQVSYFKINAEGLLQNDESSMIFIETLTQHYQSLDVLELLLDCIQLKLDFPFEHLLVDCIMYGVLASESSLDPHIEQLERVFTTYLQLPIPEVRERIFRKIYSKLRIQISLSVNKKTISNIALLSKFLYRKSILNQLINGLLINSDVAQEETRLQMSVGTLIVKILIIAFNEGGQISQKSNLNTHILTFHSMIKRFPDCIGLLDLIEENAQSKSLRFQRLLRDLFNQDSQKREFATSVLRTNLSKESQDTSLKDLVAETFDVKKNPAQETILELEAINQNYDSSTVDMMNIQSILMSTSSDFQIKKSCLEQLTLILFDVQSKRGKQLFKAQVSSGSRDLFNFLVHEILSVFNTCQGYLRQQSSLLDLSHLTYLSECFKFIFYSALLFQDEPEIKTFFSKFRQLTSSTQQTQTPSPATDHEQFLSATVFFAGSVVIRSNALKSLFMTLFNPVILSTKVSKQQLTSGTVKRALQAYVADFTQHAFIMIVPNVPQQVKMPVKEDLIMSEEQQMYVHERLREHDRHGEESLQVAQIAKEFVRKAQDKNENFNNVMKNLEQIQNLLLSLQSLRDEVINTEVLNSMAELLKTLPTRDFEFSFLADFFMILAQILHSHRKFQEISNLQLMTNRICDAIRYHLLPFLIEGGNHFLKDTEQLSESQFQPKSYFIQRFLEVLNSLMTVDLYLSQQHRLGSGIQDRILNNTAFFDYLLDLHSMFRQEGRRKLQVFFNTLITNFDSRAMKHERLTEVLMNTVATHKASLLMCNHSILMLAIRSLMVIQHRRFSNINSKQVDISSQSDLSVQLNVSSVSYLQKFQSFGWIIRFVDNRDTRVRVMAWDLITSVFDYEFLRTNPSIVQTALNAYLQHQELFSVKISVLKFLLKVCDSLMHNCDLFRDFDVQQESSPEPLGIRELLSLVSKQALISQMHVILTQKDTPLLFITLSIKLLHKLVQMDHKKALPVMTQLDYWTQLVDMINPQVLQGLERHENRIIIANMKEKVLRCDDPCRSKDMIVLTLNAIIEFIFEGFKKDAQLANMLVKTTKLLSHIFDTLRSIIDEYNSEKGLVLLSKNLLIIFFDKVVKLLHVALMHPRDYTVEALQKFLFEEHRVPQVDVAAIHQAKQSNWIYVTEMFRITNELSSSCSYIYGQIEVKLALSRFISEFLMRLPDVEINNHLDDMVMSFDGTRYFDENEVYSREELRTYGSFILVEMGMVFRGLYLDKDQKAQSSIDELQDHENSKIDINICLCILLAKSKSAKTIAIEQNLAKKIIDICQENVSALHLANIQKLTQKSGGNQSASQKSMIGKSASGLGSNSALVKSVFESQIKRQYKYANFSDVEMCERETLRMLHFIRHLFYESGELLIPSLISQPLPTQSKISINQKKPSAAKKQESLGDKLVNLWAQIIDELGNSSRYNEIINETLRGAITFAAQNYRFKGLFSASVLPSSNLKKNSLLKVFNDKLLLESLQGNTMRMKFLFTLFRSLSMYAEIAKEMMKLRIIEDLLEKILPVCKNEKDIKLMKNYLSHFSSFIAGFSFSEEGQKILLKLKDLYELTLFILDTITPVPAEKQQVTTDTRALTSLVTYSLLFLRNSAFNRTTKLIFLSNAHFLPCLLAFLSAQTLSNTTATMQLKAYTAACIWVVLFNHQGVKAMMSREEIVREIQILRQDYQRQVDIENYQYYLSKDQQDPLFNSNYIHPHQQEDEDSHCKVYRDFTLQALNCILQLLSQA